MLFNTVGALIYYVCQWFMQVVIVHISGYEKAGILSLTFTITAAPAVIGLFNVRNYQVSDVDGEYTRAVYLRSRTITNILSFVICAVMVLAGGYSSEKAVVILLFMLFKISEGYADVYYGIEQRWGRLDVTGISQAVRGILIIAAFVLTMILTDSLALGMIAIAAVSMLVILVYDIPFTKKLGLDQEADAALKDQKNAVWTLLRICVPLALVGFCNTLSVHLPKIMLEYFHGSEIMGYYNSVASPTLVVQLAATTIFAPLIPPLTESFRNGRLDEFLATLKKFFLFVLALSILCLVASKLLAKWGLELLFGESIDPYIWLFVPVIFATIMIALNVVLTSICTLMRIITAQYIVGIVGIIASILAALICVKQFSMIGVVYAQIIAVGIQCILQIILIYNKIKNRGLILQDL